MARLIDHILGGKLQPTPWVQQAPGFTQAQLYKQRHKWQATLKEVPVICVDNVADYFFEHEPTGLWNTKKDFPNLVPPFPKTWIEYRNPHEREHRDSMFSWCGFYFQSTVIQEKLDQMGELLLNPATRKAEIQRLWREVERYSSDYLLDVGKRASALGYERAMLELPPEERELVAHMSIIQLAEEEPETLARLLKNSKDTVEPNSEWTVKIQNFMGNKDDVIGPMCEWTLRLEKDGSIVHEPVMHVLTQAGAPAYPESISVNHYLIQPAFLALTFMHCKNVRTIDVPANPKLNQARARKHKRPFVDYKVLEIDPLREILRHTGMSQTTGLKQALHVCRGHFKTYDERPLFGRVKGTFWWPASLKGSANRGVIEKDYTVKGK
jgi:hypothetical protein